MAGCNRTLHGFQAQHFPFHLCIVLGLKHSDLLHLSPRTRHPPPLANSLPPHGRFDIDQGSAVEAVEPRDGQDVAGNGGDR